MSDNNTLKTFDVKSIHLEITGKCNIACKYCYNAQFNNKKKIEEELTTADVKRLIREASDMGCRSFTFSGGEPFTRNDIFEILDACAGKQVNFLTNAKLLMPEFIDKLTNYPQINEIKISLDGFEGHDYVRYGSNSADVIKSIQNLKKHGIKVVINTEVTEINVKEMPKLYQTLKELKVDRWRVDLPFILGRYKFNYLKYRLPDFSEFIKIFKEILIDYLKSKPSFELELFNVYKSELTPINAISFDHSMHPCAYRTGSFPMRPNGDMIFCPSMDMPMSNFLKSGSLRKAIEDKYKHEFYNIKISDIKKCQNCRFLNLCNTGCRVDAYYYMGDFKEVDPICCNLMPLIEKEIIPILPKELSEFYKKLIEEKGEYPEQYDIDKLVKNKTL